MIGLLSFVCRAAFVSTHVHAIPTYRGTLQASQTHRLDPLKLSKHSEEHSHSETGSYAPPDTCQTTCADLLDILKQCNDDSCVCSQTGVDAFFQCASCDDRLARKQGVYNAEETFEDLKQICESQGYAMTSVYLPSQDGKASNAAYTFIEHSTAFRLTSIAYASLSIHSAAGTPTLASATELASTPEPSVVTGTVQQQSTGSASIRYTIFRTSWLALLFVTVSHAVSLA